MKSRVFSLALLLLAGAATGALAQDQGRQYPPGAGVNYRAAHEARERAQPAPQATPATAPAAPPAAAAPQAPGWRRDGQGGDHRQWQGGGERRPEARPPAAANDQRWRGQDRRDDNRAVGGRWNGANRWTDDRRPTDQRAEPRAEDHRNADQRRDRRDDDRGRWQGGDHRQEWRDHDRRDDGRRDHDRRDGRRWDQRRYPPIYNSPSRYHGWDWRPPSGFYVRAWRFGEILPRGWYDSDYRILDWWEYDLPEPPPGYDWVRVGSDAVLIDSYSGRIVQVVRALFW